MRREARVLQTSFTSTGITDPGYSARPMAAATARRRGTSPAKISGVSA
jgi:hypothetical protein